MSLLLGSSKSQGITFDFIQDIMCIIGRKHYSQVITIQKDAKRFTMAILPLTVLETPKSRKKPVKNNSMESIPLGRAETTPINIGQKEDKYGVGT